MPCTLRESGRTSRAKAGAGQPSPATCFPTAWDCGPAHGQAEGLSCPGLNQSWAGGYGQARVSVELLSQARELLLIPSTGGPRDGEVDSATTPELRKTGHAARESAR